MSEVVKCCFTLVEEVDGLHACILLIADLQLMELTKQIDQLLHHLHPILTETTQTHHSSVNYRFHDIIFIASHTEADILFQRLLKKS